MIGKYKILDFTDTDKVGISVAKLGLPMMGAKNEITLMTKEEARLLCEQLNKTNVVDTIAENLDAFEVADRKITPLFNKIFHNLENKNLVNHLIDHWMSKKNFFSFYLNLDSKCKRVLLEYFDIEVSPDKYANHSMSCIKLVEGEKRLEVFSYETEILHQFCLFGYNNSLEILKKIDHTGEAWSVVEDNGIDPFGNSENWFKWWQSTSVEVHSLLINHIIKKANE